MLGRMSREHRSRLCGYATWRHDCAMPPNPFAPGRIGNVAPANRVIWIEGAIAPSVIQPKGERNERYNGKGPLQRDREGDLCAIGKDARSDRAALRRAIARMGRCARIRTSTPGSSCVASVRRGFCIVMRHTPENRFSTGRSFPELGRTYIHHHEISTWTRNHGRIEDHLDAVRSTRPATTTHDE